MQDGQVRFLLPNGTQEDDLLTQPLPQGMTAVGTASGFGLCCTALHQTVVLSRRLGGFRVPDGGELLCCGEDFAVLRSEEGVALCLFGDEGVQVQTLDLRGALRFGGRTSDGLLLSCGGEWLLWRMTEATESETVVIPYQPETPAEEVETAAFCAASVLCTVSEAVCGVKLAEDGAPFALSPAVAGFTARRETDGETLLLAAATLLETIPSLPVLPEETRARLCLYLCGSLLNGTDPAEALLFADGNATGLLLDVSLPELLPARLEAVWELLLQQE